MSEGNGTPVVVEDFDPAMEAQRQAAEGVKALALPDDRTRTTVVQGTARTALVDASGAADLLVVGSQGHTALGGVALGSMSASCVRHAHVPVVVVR